MEAFIPYIQAVGRGEKLKRDLTCDEAEEAMRLILAGDASPAQVGAFLVSQRVKGESAEEIVGFTRAARAFAQQIAPRVEGLMDLGLPYDGKVKTLQLAPAVAIVLAAAGQPVVFHGAPDVPTKRGVGPAEVLAALDIPADLPPEVVERQVEEVGIGFLYAPRFIPAWHALTPIRQQFGLRTALNTVEKFLNPANAPLVVAGFFHMGYLQRMRLALQALFGQGWIIQGPEGSIECPPGRATRVLSADPAADPLVIDSQALGLEGRGELAAPGEPAAHARLLHQLLADPAGAERADALRFARDTLFLTAGLLLFLGGRAVDLAAGVELARQTVEQGAALERLQAWQALCRAATVGG